MYINPHPTPPKERGILMNTTLPYVAEYIDTKKSTCCNQKIMKSSNKKIFETDESDDIIPALM
jgi:hypothetical protein